MTENSQIFKELDEIVTDIMIKDGPDGHIDGHDKIVNALLSHHKIEKALLQQEKLKEFLCKRISELDKRIKNWSNFSQAGQVAYSIVSVRLETYKEILSEFTGVLT